MEAFLLGCSEHIITVLWKFSFSLTVAVAFPFGKEVVRGFKQYFFSSSNLPIFTKCVGALETSVPPSVLVEGAQSVGETHTHTMQLPQPHL